MWKRKNRFMKALSPDIEQIINWYREPDKSTSVPKNMNEFAERFLYAICYDGAYFPIFEGWDFGQLLALVLTLPEKYPDNPMAWMNLGFAYRRMALNGVSDPSRKNDRRRDLALECFARSLKLESHNPGCWVGRAFIYTDKGDHQQAVECFRNALDIDSGNPVVWLHYAAALKYSGRLEEGLAAMDSAFEIYASLDEESASTVPEEFRVLLDEWGQTRPDFTGRK
jgi:tetratricopeptide (TPR) repeat protein